MLLYTSRTIVGKVVALVESMYCGIHSLLYTLELIVFHISQRKTNISCNIYIHF